MEKYKFCKKLNNQKGAISIFTVLAMIFFLMFILGAFIFASRRSQTQAQSLSDLRSVYKQNANEIYEDMVINSTEDTIPIYAEKDFFEIGNNVIREINGKNYLFNNTANYVFQNDIKIDLLSNITPTYIPKDYTIYTNDFNVSEGSYDVYYMYDETEDYDEEKEKYKLLAYNKIGEDIPANTLRNKDKFNIIHDGSLVGGLETLDLDIYKYNGNLNFLLVYCVEESGVTKTKISKVKTLDTTPTTLTEILTGIDDFKSIIQNYNVKQYYLLVRAQTDAVEVYVDTLEKNLASKTSEITFTLSIVNNTKKSINYNVNSTASYFTLAGGNASADLASGDNAKIKLKVKSKDGYIYIRDEDYIKMAVNVKNDVRDENTEFQLKVNTYNYDLFEMMQDKETIKTTTPNFEENVTTVASSGLFRGVDETGYTYYYRGINENNYVKFANKIWRIVRKNGDGSYRLILQDAAGTSPYSTHGAGYTQSGYMYSEDSAEAKVFNANIGKGNKYDTTIKTFLESWYAHELLDYENYIDKNAIFWCERNLGGNGGAEWNSNGSYIYSGWYRTVAHLPTLVAADKKDMFSVTTSKGNGVLKRPIGLLTVDEIFYAGGSVKNFSGWLTDYTDQIYENKKIYLYNSNIDSSGFWTITPRRHLRDGADGSHIFFSTAIGVIHVANPTEVKNVRPVINLKSTVKVKGSGTAADPYRVREY